MIVGAGSSGATLASRLADQGRTVHLLEAGPDYRASEAPDEMFAPNPSNIVSDERFAHFRYDALTASRTDQQQAYTYWRGAGLGGSSAINGQIAIRGVPSDYDAWADEGCEGWSFAEVLPYFKRLETDQRYATEPYHGDAGPIPIYRAPQNQWGPMDLALAESAANAGFAWAPDHNAPGAIGVSPYAINSKGGARVSVNDGYLEPRRGLNNLSITGGVLVDRVIFEGRRAVGVEAIVGGERQVFYGDNIVLSAGAVHSPTILLRSGIGPEEELRRHDITMRQCLPVGEGFQDHPMIAIVLPLSDDVAVEPNFRHTNCCVRFSSELANTEAGDLMMVALNCRGDSLAHRIAEAHHVRSIGMMGVWVNACESRGQVQLASASPQDQPLVRLGMLATERDRRQLYTGFQRLSAMVSDDVVRSVTRGLVLDADRTTRKQLDHYPAFVEWACRNASDTQHASCSCRMGDGNDPRTVVDSNCQVLGMDNLYVIDASVMPNVPSANTNLTAIMIGEKMADHFSL